MENWGEIDIYTLMGPPIHKYDITFPYISVSINIFQLCFLLYLFFSKVFILE